MDIAKRAASEAKRAARQAELDQRDSEHGGMRSIDVEVAEQQKRDSMRGWRDRYKVSATWREVEDAQAGIVRPDPRRVTIQRLWIDLGAAIRRWAPKYRLGKESGDTLRADALLLLLKWSQHGGGIGKDGERKRPLDLGGEEGFPLRRDWLEPTHAETGPRDKLTGAAWEALHAAVLQAAKSPAMRKLAPEQEIATDPLNIAELVEQEQRETGAATRLPDNAAPEVIARHLDLPLDAARSIVARAYPAASRRELGAAWGMKDEAVKKALTRGDRAVRERFPDSAQLLEALDQAASAHRAEVAADVVLALLDWRDGIPSAAHRAVADWRDAFGTLPPEQRALAVAAFQREQRASRRERRPYDPARAERIAGSTARLLRAEGRRMRDRATSSARGSVLLVPTVSPARQAPPISGARKLSSAERVWTYGLTARDDRAARR